MKHKHAELMALYAQDAMETVTPWKGWQHRICESNTEWTTCVNHPSWNRSYEYRRKPRTIKIGEYDVPKPDFRAPKIGEVYFIASVTDAGKHLQKAYCDDAQDERWISQGLAHKSREAAELHAEALLSLTTKPSCPT